MISPLPSDGPSPDDLAVAASSELVTQAARLVRFVRRTHDLPAGFRVIAILDELGPQGVSALAEADHCSQPTMSTAVRDLAAQGWVTKSADPRDARAAVVTLTDAGRDELARVRRRHGQAVAARLRAGAHSPEDVATAVAVLRDVLETSACIPTTPHENEREREATS